MSSRSLDDLHPRLQPLASLFLVRCKQIEVDWLITTTYRSPQEQDYLYALGRTVRSHVGPWSAKFPLGKKVTNAKGRQSEHNFELKGRPASLAFDGVPLINGKPVWDENSPLWQKAGEIGVELGLNWYGAPGAPFKEFPHFALMEAKTIMSGSQSS